MVLQLVRSYFIITLATSISASPMSLIKVEIKDSIACILMQSPPVNALGKAMRISMLQALQQVYADQSVQAVVIGSQLPLFCGGADIEEFKTDVFWDQPNLHDLIEAIETAPKLTVAAINGAAMGGAVELALACDYRYCGVNARLGLPEIHLGLFPGAGGTQRLPRIVGLEIAADIILEGDAVPAGSALQLGLADAQLMNPADDQESFIEQAIFYTQGLLAQGAPLCRSTAGPLSTEILPVDFFNKLRDEIKASADACNGSAEGGLACVDSLQLSTELEFVAAINQDADAFKALLHSPHSLAKRHLFFAKRQAYKVPGLQPTAPLAIKQVGVLGAKKAGQDLALAALQAGFAVALLAFDEQQATSARATLSACLGSDTQFQVTTQLEDLSAADLLIEAQDLKNIAKRQTLWEKLGQHCGENVVFAARAAGEALKTVLPANRRHCIGLQALGFDDNVDLLEIARCSSTSDEALSAFLQFSKRLGAQAVVLGTDADFASAQMLTAGLSALSDLLQQGVQTEQINQALEQFGLRCSLFDLAEGIQVESPIMTEIDRLKKESDTSDISAQCIGDMTRCAQTLLRQKQLARASDADLIAVLGLGFPDWRGGPLYYAEHDG